ncbi:MAG: hypothetical protein HeimC2_46070 [Candidatus Heimdallarchaeota archaeon LC_2]|nr:MAG: hypothetical protein HeimC2_46070 [Candidatus Heimdallarchaeota archaeon LC_2]
MYVEYFSMFRQILLFIIIGIPILLVVLSIKCGRKVLRENDEKRDQLLSLTKLYENDEI